MMVLRAHPMCSVCMERAATDVHHRIPLSRGGTDIDGNLQALCHECHAAITAREEGRGRAA